MNVPFRVSLINAHARSGRPVLGDRAGAAAFAAGLKATVLAVEEVQSPSNPQETEIMYIVTFDQPEYWIRRGLNEVSSLTKRWPASFFSTIEDDGVRPPGYVDHNIGDGQNRQADTGGGRRKRKSRKKRGRKKRKTRKNKGGITPAELEKNVTSFMGGGRDLCEQGYGPSEEEFELLQRTIRKQIDEGELPEHLVELDGYGGLDMLMTINNVANDYCYRLKGRGAYCDQTTAKCKKQIQHRQNGGHHLYKRLGVSKYASQKQIRKAFKTLKKKRKATKKVKEAYKILSNKKTRKQYNNRYRKAIKRGGKRKTRKRKGGNENCYGFRNLEDSKLCNEIHQAAQYYDTNHPERLSRGQKIARKIKNRTTRRKKPKPESPQQVAQQKRATFLEFKDKLHPVLGKLKEAEDKIRAELIKTIEGPDDPMGEKQRELEAKYDEAFSKTNEKLSLMNTINQNLNGEDKCPFPAQIEKARNDYSNRGRIPFAPRNVPFNVAY